MADGGIKVAPVTSIKGKQLIYRDGQEASRNFKINNPGSSFKRNALVPRPKFLFFVRFVHANNIVNSARPPTALGGGGGIEDTKRYSSPNDGIVFQIKQIDKPKFNIRTEVLHQYNKKRVIQTRIDYNPMTINFHDDVADKVIQFWIDYYRYFYGDASKNSSTAWAEDIVTSSFNEGSGPGKRGEGWGYLGQFHGDNVNNKHFLERIELLQFYGGEYTTISFVHPKITVFDHDANDYADGREGQGIRMTFDYEGVIYNVENPTPVDEVNAEEFGFSDTYYKIPFGKESNSGGGKEPISVINEITPSGLTSGPIPTSRQRLKQQISKESSFRPIAGSSVIDGSGFSFGTGSLRGLNTVDLTAFDFRTNGAPSPDVIKKITGVRNTTENFGEFKKPENQLIFRVSSDPPNTGLDATSLDRAKSTLAANIPSREISIGNGQSTITTGTEQNSFTDVAAVSAIISQQQGIISDVATYENSPTPTTSDGDSLVTIFSNEQYHLTNRGAAALNSLRGEESAVGTRNQMNKFEGLNTLDSNNRALAAERNDAI